VATVTLALLLALILPRSREFVHGVIRLGHTHILQEAQDNV
jgi:hypothetical protein